MTASQSTEKEIDKMTVKELRDAYIALRASLAEAEAKLSQIRQIVK